VFARNYTIFLSMDPSLLHENRGLTALAVVFGPSHLVLKLADTFFEELVTLGVMKVFIIFIKSLIDH
jgi:hypothetical protein